MELFPDKVGPITQIGTNLLILDLLILAILYKLIISLSSLIETIWKLSIIFVKINKVR